MNKERLGIVAFIVLISIMLLAFSVSAEMERTTGYFTMINEEGEVVSRTAHQVVVGDMYLTSDNLLYQVKKVEDDTARLRLIKRVQLDKSSSWLSDVWQNLWQRLSKISVFSFGEKLFADPEGNELSPVQGDKRPIAVYHTHSDESYVPTEGRSSIEYTGGVLEVGAALTRAFEREGVSVLHDLTPHDPHDAGAYDRSRRTAVELLKKRPVAVLDLHRDAVPKSEYTKEIDGRTVSKIQLVVGRQNPNKGANEAFAGEIKRAVDNKHPGLIKGIFYADGKYNQDLAPRLLLLEIGTHVNTRAEAEEAAALFASAARDVLALPGATSRSIGSGAFRSLLWIIGLAGVGLVSYLLLNKGWSGIRDEIGQTMGEIKTAGEDDHEAGVGPSSEDLSTFKEKDN